jgi:hypothetical protein
VQTFEAPKQAYDSRLQVAIVDGFNAGGGTFDPVPPGKQLIVTFASGFAHTQAPNASFRISKTFVGGSTIATHQLKPVPTGTQHGIVAGEPLHLIVNPGEELHAVIARASILGDESNNEISISGYLVDLP